MPRSLLISTILTTVIIAALSVGAEASPQRTIRRIPRHSTAARSERSDYDTLAVSRGMIGLNGYDKPLRSNTETMFVTNHTQEMIRRLSIIITYSDIDGRELHRRKVKVNCEIPPSSTRLIDFPSWDRQKTFYYRLSQRPQRADGTPYNVTCECDTIVTLKSQINISSQM